MEIIGYVAAIFIGISLGLIGGGGSILTVPILVYLFDVPADLATSYSLFIVGLTAGLGAYRHLQIGNLHIQTALVFAVPSILSALLMRKFVLPVLPDTIISVPGFSLSRQTLIMVVFALLMLAASFSMIRSRSNTAGVAGSLPRLVLIGFLVGIVTGFLGAGGGFLIIPALVFFAGLDMKSAIGTSLLIIFINSLITFSGDLLRGVSVDYIFLIRIAVVALVGMFIGTLLARKISGARLKPVFGWFVLLMGGYIIAKELLSS